MKLSIRLQNHGRKNHPLWWIVIAPNRKNIFGRFIQHVGYWSPRHGVYLQRQIVLNIPRIKYWISCGAVPTYKVQKFLSLWNILPAPWYYQKSEQELAKDQPQGQQLTDKKKRKLEWKQKRKNRQALAPQNYYKEQARLKFLAGWKRKFQDLQRTQQRQNQILRQLLLHNQFHKIARMNQLTGKTTFTDTQQIKQLKQSLKKARAQLTLIRKNKPTTSAFQQTKSMKLINQLTAQIRKVQMDKQFKVFQGLDDLQESQYLTQDVLQKKLQYQLITKKLQKNFQDLQTFTKLNQPVLLQQYADFLVQKLSIDPQQAYAQAQKQFVERGVSGNPLTKYELFYWDQLKREEADQQADVLHPDLRDANLQTIIKKAVQVGDCILPTKRSVHPAPDLEAYIPQQYYEPITSYDFKLKLDDPLSPYQQLQKYHEKKKKSSIVI